MWRERKKRKRAADLVYVIVHAIMEASKFKMCKACQWVGN